MSYWDQRRIGVFLPLALVLPLLMLSLAEGQAAQGVQQASEAKARAYQAYFRALRDLPPSASKEQIKALKSQYLSPAKETYRQAAARQFENSLNQNGVSVVSETQYLEKSKIDFPKKLQSQTQKKGTRSPSAQGAASQSASDSDSGVGNYAPRTLSIGSPKDAKRNTAALPQSSSSSGPSVPGPSAPGLSKSGPSSAAALREEPRVSGVEQKDEIEFHTSSDNSPSSDRGDSGEVILKKTHSGQVKTVEFQSSK